MNNQDKEKLTGILEQFINNKLYAAVISNPFEKDKIIKIKLRPLIIKGSLWYQAEEFTEKQAFHKNMTAAEACAYIGEAMDGCFKQLEITSEAGQVHVLVSKKGKATFKIKSKAPAKITDMPQGLAHNRKKQYVLEEGVPVPFLIDLGVMTDQGAVIRSRYDKFRQINRFLEFIEDILPKLDKEKETTIIDFGCGKSYLTFAMYHYLKVLKGYPIKVIGLDLKKDVIERCSRLSKKYGYDTLTFCTGDIASYEGVDHVDMVVTLHACDTATDYALAKAVGWGAKVILSVPCCQHQLNSQMENKLMEPIFHYGLLKERMAALYTDGLRAEILENVGYRTQVIEFIDMEHTPKNILIRAVKQGKPKDNKKELKELMDFLHVKPVLASLLLPTE